jgi:carboxymethylenebutenolidase
MNGQNTRIRADDGFESTAYVSRPGTAARAGLVILPEIFGVNAHIRTVADRYAALGYLAVAPSVFDRVHRDLDLGYDDESVRRGQALMREIDWTLAVMDIEAAGRLASEAGPVGVVGYCWGGTAAWVTAARGQGFTCAVSYYGNAIPSVLSPIPRIPMMLHWGERDHLISMERMREPGLAAPDVEVHFYATGHGFNCDARPLYHAPSAQWALARTLTFLERSGL